MKKRILILFAMFVLFSGFTLSWDTPTYTDNTVIGPEALGIFYNVEMDGTTRAAKITGNSWVLPSVTKGSAHQFKMQTELGALDNTGTPYRSAWSPSYGWTSPLGMAGPPGNLRVAP
jgi:hypothetical protein